MRSYSSFWTTPTPWEIPKLTRWLLAATCAAALIPRDALGQASSTEPPSEAPAAPAPAPPEPTERASEAPHDAPPVPTFPNAPEPPAPSNDVPPATIHIAPGQGLTVASRDDRYSIALRGRLQVRETLLVADGQQAATAPFGCAAGRVCNDTEIRRARLLITGNTFSPHIRYQLLLGFAAGDLEHLTTVSPTTASYNDFPSPVLDAFVSFTYVRDANLTVGQLIVPWDHARWIGESPTQFVERSNIVSELSFDRDVGVLLSSSDLFGLGGRLSYQLGVLGGRGRNRLPVPGQGFGFLYVARVQVAPLGGFDDMVEGDLTRRSQPRFAISAGAAYNQNADRAYSDTGSFYTVGTYNDVHAFGDAIVKWRGVSLLAEVLYRQATVPFHDGTPTGGMATREFARSGAGWLLQGGAMLTNHLEVGARWAEMLPIGSTATGQHDPAWLPDHELGGVVNWYFVGHDLKVQADYFYLYGAGFDGGRSQIRVQLAATL